MKYCIFKGAIKLSHEAAKELSWPTARPTFPTDLSSASQAEWMQISGNRINSLRLGFRITTYSYSRLQDAIALLTLTIWRYENTRVTHTVIESRKHTSQLTAGKRGD